MDAGTNSSRDGGLEPSSISSTLLERVRARRPEAWQRLVDLYGPVVYRWCRQLGVSRADAADVVQDVFAAVTADVGRFRRDRPGDSFGAWLRTITRHRVCDHFRRRQGQPDAGGGSSAYEQLLNLAEAGEESSSAQPVEEEGRFSRRVLDLIRAEFERRTWEAFWQIVVDGRSPAEVAAAMGLSLPAVYKAKSRVLRRLRQELGGLEAG
jgi:RNA polymerase sigma-70 factor (ECF subfamily)